MPRSARSRPFGRLVTFAAACEAPQPVDPVRLMRRNLAVVGFWLTPVLDAPELFGSPLSQPLTPVIEGRFRPIVGARHPLAEARRAHDDIHARRTTGKPIQRS
jgi:NADPH2:quinone reductase